MRSWSQNMGHQSIRNFIRFQQLIFKQSVRVTGEMSSFCARIETWKCLTFVFTIRRFTNLTKVEDKFFSNTSQNYSDFKFWRLLKRNPFKSCSLLSNVDAKFSKDRKFRKQNKTFPSIKLDICMLGAGRESRYSLLQVRKYLYSLMFADR